MKSPNVQCDTCGLLFFKRNCDIAKTNHNFCCKSCSAKYVNKNAEKMIKNRKKKTKKCLYCDELIFSSRKRCSKCIQKFVVDDLSLREAIYKNHHKSSAFALIRTRARAIGKKQGWKSCKACGYSKHIEIGHIKPIKDFPLDTMVSEINHISNLVPLCPNCHWEFDHGLITLKGQKD